MVALIPFAHRRNSDASIDSICTTCFQTIASEDSESKLIAHEECHLCDPYWQFSRAQVDAFPESIANRRRQPPEARPIAF